MTRSWALFAAIGVMALAVGCGGDGGETAADAGEQPAGEKEGSADDQSAKRGDEASNSDEAGSGRTATDGDGASDQPANGGSGKTPEQAIRSAIEGFLASGDPSVVCEETVTETFLREAFGDRRGCEDAQSSGSAARSVEIKKIDIDAGSAFAVAVPKGGPSGGDRLEIELVDEGDWLIDRISSDVPVGP